MQAYDSIVSDREEAIRLFSKAIGRDSMLIQAQRQLGYLYLDKKDYSAAVERFRASERLHSSDTIRLQLAYALAQAGKSDEARKTLNQLKYTGEPYIRTAAEAQLRALEYISQPPKTWPRLYGETFYDTRWKSTFFNFSFQIGEYLDAKRRFGIYGVAALATDTKSSGGEVPTIISDNSLILAGGLRVNLLRGLFLELQEGVAYYVVDRGASAHRVENDFRAVATYGNGLYAPFSLHSNVRFPFAPALDFYSSVGYYSRYQNSIGYFQLRPGFRLLEVSRTVADVYGIGKLILDTRQEFYNNVFETGAGLRVTPNVNFGLHLVGEYIYGSYLDVSDAATAEREELYDARYNCFRFMIIIDTVF